LSPERVDASRRRLYRGLPDELDGIHYVVVAANDSLYAFAKR
jgi:hypothetical protein